MKIKNIKHLLCSRLFACSIILIFNFSFAQSVQSKFEKAAAFDQGFTGLLVKDLEKNEIIYDRQSNKYFTPASNIKLFTFYTGLKVLKDSIPGLKYWIRQDSLFFTGTGDPSFLNPDLPPSKAFNFLKERKEQLFYVPAVVAEEHYGPGWAWDDYNSAYSPERADFPIFGNLVTFNFYSSGRPPVASPRIFQDSISVQKFSGEVVSGIKRDLTRNFYIYQNIPALPKQRLQKLPFKYSPHLLTKLLSDTLNREVKLIKHLPLNLGEPTIVMSVPADSLYKRMLQESDNFIAEQILLISAQQLSDSPKAEVSIKYIQDRYLKDLPDKVFWVDGSGLSRYNLATPRSMVKLLEKIYEEVPRERLFDLLATGGESGTLKYNYWAPEPFIFAKTGTLLHNHSMSGYLRTRSGKILAFSFMNSNYPVPTREIKRQMEIILRDFYLNY